MRIEWKPSEYCDVGQFIIYADSEFEADVFRRFATKCYDKKWEMCLHGMHYACGATPSFRSFNFGYRKKK